MWSFLLGNHLKTNYSQKTNSDTGNFSKCKTAKELAMSTEHADLEQKQK